MNEVKTIAASLGVAALVAGAPAFAEPVACVDLAAAYVAPDVAITSTTEVPEVTTGPNASPAHCDVRGTIRGNIKFALFLPVEWNGRFQMVGNGGKAGSISIADMRPQLRLGYAVSSTDTGHDATLPAEGGARFGNDLVFGKDREIDFGWRAVHLTAVTTKAITGVRYGSPANYSYWNGCSTGGRQGLMEAQRFPEDFDGYIVGAPVYNYTHHHMTAPALMPALYSRIPPRQNTPSDGPVLSPAKRDMLGAAIYARCDALDGVTDGQLRNPLKCDFDPARHIPACSATSGTACLTPQELAAVQTIYHGREPFVPGLPYGAENIPAGWVSWLLPNSPTGTPPIHSIIADAFEWLMFNPDRPGFTYLTQWNWSKDPYLMDEAASIFNATDPDLRDVKESGKKIIMYHGWSDAGANPIRTIRYRQSVVQFLEDSYGVAQGRKRVKGETWKGEKETDKFLRLYMIPGMGHCGGGVGHANVDWVSPLVNWVENGVAPEAIVGSKTANGITTSRPHCPYPQEAVWDGVGDVNEAESYTCKTLD
jgi:feruloyl esterase